MSALDSLFEPLVVGGLRLSNRFAMAPMTRSMSPNGVPGLATVDYYRRRAEGGVGLVITEGTYIDAPGTAIDPAVPRFYGADALAGWRDVADAVHAAGGRVVPQLWHVGLVYTRADTLDLSRGVTYRPSYGQIGPSGLIEPGRAVAEPMSSAQIDQVIGAFANAAADAERLGFDGVEIHAAHGYLIDQFFWSATNRREDAFGGSPLSRGRLAGEIVAEVRRRVAPDFPIFMRISQWKQQDYKARMAESPDELAALIEPAVAAGVDLIHCSQRRFWEPAFADSDRNLAAWVKALTGKPTMTVGSVGLDRDFLDSLEGGLGAGRTDLQTLLALFTRGDFDLVAVGRALIGDAAWTRKIRDGRAGAITNYDPAMLASLT